MRWCTQFSTGGNWGVFRTHREMWAAAFGIYQGVGETVRIVELTLRKQQFDLLWSGSLLDEQFVFLLSKPHISLEYWFLKLWVWLEVVIRATLALSKAVSRECHLAEDRKNWWEPLIKLQMQGFWLGEPPLCGAWDGAHTWEVGGRLQMQWGLGEHEWKVLAPTFAGTSWTSTLEFSFPDRLWWLWLIPSLPCCIFSIVTAHVL